MAPGALLVVCAMAGDAATTPITTEPARRRAKMVLVRDAVMEPSFFD